MNVDEVESSFVSQQLLSYQYVQFADDPNIGALFSAFNQLAQQFLDDINGYQLPIFLNQSGALLDWAATSIYGIVRQNLSSGGPRPVGPLNSAPLNSETLNGFSEINSSTTYLATDQIYQRILQWNTFKGDGFQFTPRWLKRRVQRFLTGDLFPDQTYQVSVHFVTPTHVVITVNSAVRFLTGGAFFNENDFNADGISLNEADTEAVVYTSTALAGALRAAIISGLLTLPFQYEFTVNIA